MNAGVAPPAADLRQPAKTRPHRQPLRVFRQPVTEPLRMQGHLWARTRQGHLALQHVPQLRQLVDIKAPQPAPKPRAWRKVFVAPIVGAGLKARRGSADLVQYEWIPAAPQAQMPE